MIRFKKRESTHCTWTESGNEIREGDILGYGDNYPCLVIYDPFEAQFKALEFGYLKDEGYIYRHHDIISYTVPWKILGNVDQNPELLEEGIPEGFCYVEDIQQYYKFKPKN